MSQHNAVILLLIFMATAIVSPVLAEDKASSPLAPDKKLPRDPFWPVGFTPVKKNKIEKEKELKKLESKIKWPKLKPKGFSKRGGHASAFIEGVGFVEEGQIISQQKDGIAYRWKIAKITKKAIRIERLGWSEITTPLQKQ
jgi:hypothetical protein